MKLNMKSERIRKNMTIEQVAAQLGVHANAVSRWENGASEPNGRHLVQLATLYDCTPEYLLGIVNDRHARAIPALEN